MQTSDWILLGIGVLITFVGYVFKRTLEGMQTDIAKLQEQVHQSQVNEAEIKAKQEASLQALNRIEERLYGK